MQIKLKNKDSMMYLFIIIYTFFMEIVNRNIWTVFICVLIQFIILLFVFNKDNKKIWYKNWFKSWDKKITIFLLYSIAIIPIYIVFNLEYTKSIIYAALIYVNMILSALIWLSYLKEETNKRTNNILKCFSYCGVILSITVIIEKLVRQNIFYGFISKRDSLSMVGRITYLCFGSMGHHIVLSMYLVFICLISIYLYKTYKYKKFLIMSIINFIAICIVGSRTGYICIGVLIIVALLDYLIVDIKNKNTNKTKIVALLFLILAMLIIYFSLVNKVSFFSNISYKFTSLFNGREKASLTHRLSAISITLSLLKNSNVFQILFGRGYGILAVFLETNNLYASEMSNFYIIDNQWASLLYNNGFLVLIGFILLLFKKIFNKNIYTSKQNYYYILIKCLFLMIAIYMFSFDTFTWMISTSVIGFSYALSLIENSEGVEKMMKNNLKYNKNSTVYVVCPAFNKTGGTELAHQLVFECNRLGINSIITYYGEGKDGILKNSAFEKYIESYITVNEVQDDEKNIIIFPEIKIDFEKKFKNIQKCIWWMSVDNFLKRNGILNSIKFYGFLRSLKYILSGMVKLLPTKLSNDMLHLYQSEYAKDFLQKNKINNLHELSDYINDSFLTQKISNVRNNIVLYNPKKGYSFTKKIIEHSKELNWKAIENMTTEEVVKLLNCSKVYIDFGDHPGKDRFPREAAISGCCVVTGKRGAAKFYEDIPIEDEFKFEDKEKNIPDIIKTIKKCIDNYEIEADKFEEYNKKIRNEKDIFIKDIEDIFKQYS